MKFHHQHKRPKHLNFSRSVGDERLNQLNVMIS